MQILRCPRCSCDLPSSAKYCPECGAESDAPTLSTLPPWDDNSPPTPRRAAVSSSAFLQARFVPGQILADRYRIVALLGKGGMGEVYRADDLRLEQSVAMKFLPETIARDGAAQARFHREVRLARQVSHPNVCRVFDIGEASGRPFLTMEYVDGEDLSSLLRRIGRLPQDKAIDISRQLCAGLAAAHDVGVLHRDLKPANVMLDSRGKVRITDFGLAGLLAPGEEEVVGGTPAYMAPEQLAGEAATAQSDIYSLGLVLYEIFTGKAAFEAVGLAELIREHASTTPKSPAQLVQDLDPVVERVILRCLEPKPESRPQSALQVAAALPGGDPLAAALAAGETPSPEMVAAAGGEGTLQPRVAWGLLLTALLIIAVVVMLAPFSTDLGIAPPGKSMTALEARAQEIIEQAGYIGVTADRGSWFERNYDFLLYKAKHFPSVTGRRDLAHAEQGAMEFFFRQGPQPLAPENSNLRLKALDPPNEVTGMTGVLLDSNGRLLAFLAVPPQVEPPPPAQVVQPDWGQMLAASGLAPASLKTAEPTWLPPVGFDRRFGWQGSYPEDPGTPIQISAASYRGKPVYFQVIAPWTRPWRLGAAPSALIVRQTTMVIAGFVTLILAALFAHRNLRLGRGDRRGATRVSVFVFFCELLVALLTAHHPPALLAEWQMFTSAVSGALLFAGSVWLYYLGFEPFVRKHWPELLISWNRLLGGKFRDPVIGRDLLVGVLLGSIMALGIAFSNALPTWFNLPGQTTIPPNMLGVGAAREAMGLLLGIFLAGLFPIFSITFTLFLMRLLLRNYWASVLVTGFIVLLTNMGGENFLLETPFAILSTAVMMLALLRFGMVALVVTIFTADLLSAFPITFNLSRWYGANSLLMFVVIAAMLVYGVRSALGNRPLLAE